MKINRKYLFSGLVVALAALLVLLKYWDHLRNPWTRDGQVRAQVILVTPNVSGQVVDLSVRDNQFVQKGDQLLQVDPRPFEASLARARASYDETGDGYLARERQVEAAAAQLEIAQSAVREAESGIKEVDAVIKKNRAELQRQKELLPQRATSKRSVEFAQALYDVSLEQRKIAEARLIQAHSQVQAAEAELKQTQAILGELGQGNASIRAARAAVREAELNLGYTRLHAPVDGYVTNLNMREGSHAVAHHPVLALVDVNSYWIDGYFKETLVARIEPGDRAVVTLMAYPDTPLEGYVESIGWGISQRDGSTGNDLLPNVSPTFEWIRLAQRVPVRIKLDQVPEGIDLRVGTTCSVLVKSGTAAEEENVSLSVSQ
ncbi:Multidrug resistance protein MdtN [Microbulbifer aggregans]|uniref:Multidrug resistance protein MdtN n=1 Tax=Microbulbifer aggregans TaxID=1769779 RepID=A0A1C9W8X9_9GAMM|nr:HlyD family secretion protein [Microbulbifer aggregans]AOS97592.1 Multidrug resistance protein MdtN [Microbulbifer aggregans]